MKYEAFKAIGLGERSAKVYLATVGLGTTSVQEISLKTGLKRPTVYLQIDDLIKHGLIEKIKIDKKNYYRGIDPKIVESKIKNNLSNLESLIPEMLSVYQNTVGKPAVQTLQGLEGVRQIYDEVAEASSLRVWSNVGKIQLDFYKEFMKLAEKVKENGIGVKEIIADTKENRKYTKLISKIAGPTYQVRTATSEGIENDTIIYGNCIAIFRLHELNMFVVKIEDKTIADSMRAIFDMAWKSTKFK
ncbi:MAG: helix-turn-helix domain-containing protein [Candidatus Paceibacterota bacterium]